jgi:cell division protein FtsB
MAKKLKRVDGVSNKKVTRPSSRTRSENKRQVQPARKNATAVAQKPAVMPDRVRVEKRRSKAAAKARPDVDAGAGARERKHPVDTRKRKPVTEKAKLPGRPKKPGARVKKPKVSEAERAGRNWRSISPRLVVFVLLLVVFIALSASPVARNFESTGQLRAMELELARQQKTTKSLQKEVAQARSLDYIEQEARRQRMVGPGEVLYLVTTNSKAPEVEYRLKALQSMDEAWERVRQMLHCTASRQADEQ